MHTSCIYLERLSFYLYMLLKIISKCISLRLPRGKDIPIYAAFVRAFLSGFTLFVYGNRIRYVPTILDLASNFSVFCTNV